MPRKDYSCATTLLDTLMNMLLAFVAMFVMAFCAAMAQKENKKKDNDNNAKVAGEMSITLTWPEEMDDDLDLWVEDPAGNVVFWSRRDEGLMHLDRDDVGLQHDQAAGSSLGNKEVVVVRSLMTGEYVVNVHAYTLRSGGHIPATVTADRLTTQTRLAARTLSMDFTGDEQTAFRILVDGNGDISLSDLPKLLTRGQR